MRTLGIISRTKVFLVQNKKPRWSNPAGLSLCLEQRSQHLPPCIAVSVQLAAEFTSAAAPRTVLQATIASDAARTPTATNFRTIVAPPFDIRNDNESLKRLSVH
jgi:hypothetical protein